MSVCLFLCVLLVEDETGAKVGLVKYNHISAIWFFPS